MPAETDIKLIELDDILRAREVIAGRVHRTPIVTATTLGEMLGVRLFFKAEVFQKTGSFKPRGALNRLHHLTDDEKTRGIITMSAGNHAAGTGYAAAALGIEATVVMPEAAPKSKIDATRGYGANVVLHGDMADLLPKLREIQQARGLTFTHPFDDPYVMAGHGTLGLEIIEDLPATPDIVVVPVGGGGLISGVATALKYSNPAIRIIGVEPTEAAAVTLALQRGEIVQMGKMNTFADGLASPFAGAQNLEHVKRYVDEVVLVSDDEIAAALGLIVERNKLVTEGAGAASFAALLHRRFAFAPGATIVCVLSGGNIDRDRLKRIL